MKGKIIKICLNSFIIFLVASAAAIFVASFLPFEFVKVRIDAFAFDKTADFFTIKFFKQIVVILRISGLGLLFVCGLLYTIRQRTLQYVSDIITASLSLVRELNQCVNDFIKKEDRIHLYTFFIILLVSIAIRVFFLSLPMAHDEAFWFLTFTQKPLHIALTHYITGNHLFFTFLSRIAYLLFGNHPWVIRLPALFAGILIVPASYVMIRIFYNKNAALLTAGIVASSKWLIWYSTNARGYTLICLIFLLIFAIAMYLKDSRNSAAWFVFALLSALGFYSIPIMLYPFGIIIVWFFLSILFNDKIICRSRLIKDLFIFLIIMSLLTLMLYAPVFLISGLNAIVSDEWVAPHPWSIYITEFRPCLVSLWRSLYKDFPTAIQYFLLAGFFASIMLHRRLSTYRIPMILAAAIWIIPVLLVQRVYPPDRVWLFLIPLFIGSACSGVSYLLRPIEAIVRYKSAVSSIASITLLIWLSLDIVHTSFLNPIKSIKEHYKAIILPEYIWTPDAEQITLFLKDSLKPGDRVLLDRFGVAPFYYYFSIYHIPDEHLVSYERVASNFNYSNRIFIGVSIKKRSYRYQEPLKTIEGILNKKGASITAYSSPKLIKRFEYWDLYEIVKK